MMEGPFPLRVCRLVGFFLCCWFVGVLGANKNCSVNPFSIPYTDVVVLFAPDKVAAHRSMAWHAGQQEVSLGMQVGTTLNSTFMPEAKVCTDNIQKGCVFWRGGIFQTNRSGTWSQDDGVIPYNASRSNKGWDYLNSDQYGNSDPISTTFPRGWDNFQVKDSAGNYVKLDGYPMVAINNGSFPFSQGMVGLASDSSFLEVLVEKNQSPSRSWGFDYGVLSKARYQPGELVIGGYNRAKVNPGSFKNYTVFPDKTKPCPLQVEVTGLTWGSADLMDGQSNFMACIEPAYWTTIMPIKVRRNFNKTMLASQNVSFISSDWEFIKYNNSDPNLLPKGDFKIKLAGGFEVTMPREDWIFPSAKVNDVLGQWDEVPGQIQTTIGNAGFDDSTEPKLPFLGSPFLSQVYLRVDYESQVFGIAPTIRYDKGAEPKPSLVKLGCDSAQNSQSSASSSPNNPGSNTPAIAGGVVGGLVIVALIGTAALCFFRRRKTQDTAPMLAVGGNDPTKEQNEAQGAGYTPYDAPPAFSSAVTPAPYTPTTSPGPYNPTVDSAGMPLPGPYYSNQQSLNMPSTAPEPVELGGSDITSELSGQPQSPDFPVAYADGGSVMSGKR